MANSISTGIASLDANALIHWLHYHVFHPTGILQIGIVGITYLISRIISIKIRQHLEKNAEKATSHVRFALNPAQFSIVLGYALWLFFLWFCQVLFEDLQLPSDLLHLAINLAIAWSIVRFAYFYIKNTFWSRLIYIIIIFFLALRVFGLWDRTVKMLGSMTIVLGNVNVSVWGMIESAAIFILLWAAAGGFNRFVSQRLASSDRLMSSDRILLQRVIRVATVAGVILISLRAAGLDLTTLAVTGGAIGFAIGIGLQKVGSNLVGGIMLLLRKPVRIGDVIAFEKGVFGASYGWITDMGALYVHVATRDGTLLLIPNETFVTQKIENLSLNDNLMRLTISFGVSFTSDLKKAISLSVSAAMNIARVLKNPGPKCLIKEFGDSTVNLSLRVWINDPQNGIGSVKDAVLSEIWDSFHANGIEIAFPQRDLHIRDSVPLRIYNEIPHKPE
ncbi:MAG: mechanosensitive ion channel domain-containing protein [Desulfobacterales bacterium]